MPAPLHLEFSLGPDRYLLPVERILAVLPLPALKALPGAPEGVAGVLDYRGAPTPVVDLSRLALGRAAADRRATRLALVRYPAPGGERALGLILEQATTVRRAVAEEFQSAGAPAAAWLGRVASAREGGLLQRVEIEGLLPEELRAVLFQAAEMAMEEPA